MKLYVFVFLSTIVHSNCHAVHNLHGAFTATGSQVQGAINKFASVVSGGLTSGLNFGFGVNVNHGVNTGHGSNDYYEENVPNTYGPYNGPPSHHHHHHHGYSHHYGYGGPPVNKFPPQPSTPYGHNPGYNQEQVQHGYGRPQSGHYGGNYNQQVQTPNIPEAHPTKPSNNQYQPNYPSGNYNSHRPGYGGPHYGGIGQQTQEQTPIAPQTYPTQPTTPNQYPPNYSNGNKPEHGYGRPQYDNNNGQQNNNQPDNKDNVKIETQTPILPTSVTPQPKPTDINSGNSPNPVPHTTKKPDDDDTPFVPLNPNKQSDSVNAPKLDDDGEEIFDLDIRIKD